MSCCPADVKIVTSIAGTTVTNQYFDMRSGKPVVMTETAYDALTKVKCPSSEPDWEAVCLQVIGNTDAALIVPGDEMIVNTITYSDTAGTIDNVSRSNRTLYLKDGTDVTATHEVVNCPTVSVVESEFCVAP